MAKPTRTTSGKARFVMNDQGTGIDFTKLAGKTLTNEQARTVTLDHLANMMDGLAYSTHQLAEAIKNSRPGA